MDARKLIVIAFLILIYDRVETLYYLVDPESKSCLFFSERCFRSDSFIYYASIRIQQIIVAMVLYLCIPTFKRELGILTIVSVCVFVEYFFTYNEPIAKLPLPFDWYFPISCSMLRLFSVLYFLTVVVAKALKNETD